MLFIVVRFGNTMPYPKTIFDTAIAQHPERTLVFQPHAGVVLVGPLSISRPATTMSVRSLTIVFTRGLM